MITEVGIKNFKSVADLTLQLGKFNVLIGSNGSGKSNILEAIAFGAAASADKLDNEFLGSRGIRTASAKLMKSAFGKEERTEPISLNFKIGQKEIPFTIAEEDKPLLKWLVKEKEVMYERVKDILISMISGNTNYTNTEVEIIDGDWQQLSSEFTEDIQKRGIDKEAIIEIVKSMTLTNQSKANIYALNKFSETIANFIIYSPEITYLRKFEEESQIKPLGVKGEGLFNVLEIFYENYGPETIDEIRKYLHIIEWFDDFEAIFDRVTGRKSLVVKDKNMPDVTLNQHNVNEGFLFLLFYISLIVSKETPAFFAIDNMRPLRNGLIKRLL